MEPFGHWESAAIAAIDAQLPHLNNPLILLVSTAPSPLLDHWCDEHSLSEQQTLRITRCQTLKDTELLSEYFGMVLIHNALDLPSKQEAMNLVGRCHNLLSNKVWLSVSETSAWSLNDFLALGFKRVGLIEEKNGPLLCFGYDLASYNHIRKWNNPKFWANPENWNKYRW